MWVNKKTKLNFKIIDYPIYQIYHNRNLPKVFVIVIMESVLPNFQILIEYV